MVGKTFNLIQIGQNNPACVLSNIYPVLACQITQVGLFLPSIIYIMCIYIYIYIYIKSNFFFTHHTVMAVGTASHKIFN